MYLDIFLKLIIGLIALLTVVRILGKKELAQLTPFDFVYTLVLGGILEESLFDEKVNVYHLLFGIVLWGMLIYLIEKVAKKWDPMRKLLRGKPVKLISNGELDMVAFDKHHLEMEQLRSALRQQGIFSLREVRDLFIEPGGQVAINKFVNYDTVTNGNLNKVPQNEDPSFLLVDEGKVKEDVLHLIGKDRTWLLDELSKYGFPDLTKIAYGVWSKTDGFFIRIY